MAIRSEYEIGIRAVTDKASFIQAKQSIDSILKELREKQFSLVNSKATKEEIEKSKKELALVSQEMEKFKRIYNDSFNASLGSINFSKFNEAIKSQGLNLGLIQRGFRETGTVGARGFANIYSNLATTNKELEHTKTIVDTMIETMGNTVRWNVASAAFNAITESATKAYDYTKKLDKSLNDIRVVTGKSAEEMAEFAKQANVTAKQLGTTTTKYTDASLIYYQQGKNNKEVREMTDITIKLANVLGVSSEEASNYMTAIWNNFAKGGEHLEYYADVITKLGAVTASSAEEISEGLSKFSAVAGTSGLSYEFASAILATITDVTRQSADIVGNGLKTILSRIQGLKLGDTLEDGTDLNKYSEALKKVGIDIKDSTGELKDADIILSEMGKTWKDLTRAQQIALAQSVAGAHQYNLLVTAMENWDTILKNVNISTDAFGELNKQNNIVLESTEAHLKKLDATKEKLYSAMVDNDTIKASINILSELTNGISYLVDAMGGGIPIISSFIGVLGALGSKKITQMFSTMSENRLIDQDKTGAQMDALIMMNKIKENGDLEEYYKQYPLQKSVISLLGSSKNKVSKKRREKIADISENYVTNQQLLNENVSNLTKAKNLVNEYNSSDEAVENYVKEKEEQFLKKREEEIKERASKRTAEEIKRKNNQDFIKEERSKIRYTEEDKERDRAEYRENYREVGNLSAYEIEEETRKAREEALITEEDTKLTKKQREKQKKEADRYITARSGERYKKLEIDSEVAENTLRDISESYKDLGENFVNEMNLSLREITAPQKDSQLLRIRDTTNQLFEEDKQELEQSLDSDIKSWASKNKLDSSVSKAASKNVKNLMKKLEGEGVNFLVGANSKELEDNIIGKVEVFKSKLRKTLFGERQLNEEETNFINSLGNKFIANQKNSINRVNKEINEVMNVGRIVRPGEDPSKIETKGVIGKSNAHFQKITEGAIGEYVGEEEKIKLGNLLKNTIPTQVTKAAQNVVKTGKSAVNSKEYKTISNGLAAIEEGTKKIEDALNENVTELINTVKNERDVNSAYNTSSQMRVGETIEKSFEEEAENVKKENRVYNGVNKTSAWMEIMGLMAPIAGNISGAIQGNMSTQDAFFNSLLPAGFLLADGKNIFSRFIDQQKLEERVEKSLLKSKRYGNLVKTSEELNTLDTTGMSDKEFKKHIGKKKRINRRILNQERFATGLESTSQVAIGLLPLLLPLFTYAISQLSKNFEKKVKTDIQSGQDRLEAMSEKYIEQINNIKTAQTLMDTYDKQSIGLKKLITDTEKYEDALKETNKTARELIETLDLKEGKDYQISLENGFNKIKIDKERLESIYKIKEIEAEGLRAKSEQQRSQNNMDAENLGYANERAGKNEETNNILTAVEAGGATAGILTAATAFIPGINIAVGTIAALSLAAGAAAGALSNLGESATAVRIYENRKDFSQSRLNEKKIYDEIIKERVAKNTDNSLTEEEKIKKEKQKIKDAYANNDLKEIKKYEDEFKEKAWAPEKKAWEKKKNGLYFMWQEWLYEDRKNKFFNDKNYVSNVTKNIEEDEEEKVYQKDEFSSYVKKEFYKEGIEDSRYAEGFVKQVTDGKEKAIGEKIETALRDSGLYGNEDIDDIINIGQAEYNEIKNTKEEEYKKLAEENEEKFLKDYLKTKGDLSEKDIDNAIYDQDKKSVTIKGKTYTLGNAEDIAKKSEEMTDAEIPNIDFSKDKESLTKQYAKMLGYTSEQIKEIKLDAESGNYIDGQGKVIVGKDMTETQIAAEISKELVKQNTMRKIYDEEKDTEEWKTRKEEADRIRKGATGDTIKRDYGDAIKEHLIGTILQGEISDFSELSFRDFMKTQKMSKEELIKLLDLEDANDPSGINMTKGKMLFGEDFDIDKIYNDYIQKSKDAYDGEAARKKKSESIKGNIDAIRTIESEKELTENQITHLKKVEDEYEVLGNIKDRTSKTYLETLRKINEHEEKENILSSVHDFSEKVGGYFRLLKNNSDGMSLKEFKDELSEIIDADYEIVVNLKVDGQSDFDNAIGSMTRIKDMASKIGEDFVVSASDVEELNNAFPGITEGMKILEDGRTQLLESSVNKAIEAGKQIAKNEKEQALQSLELQHKMTGAKLQNMKQLYDILDKAAKGDMEEKEARSKINAKLAEIDAENERDSLKYKSDYEKEMVDISGKNAEIYRENWIQAQIDSLDESERWAEGMIQNQQAVIERDLDKVGNSSTYNLTIGEEGKFKKGIGLDISGDNGLKLKEGEDLKDAAAELRDKLGAIIGPLSELFNNQTGWMDEIRATYGEVEYGLKHTGKSTKDKEKDKIKDKKDIYHDVNIELKLINEQLKILEKQEKKLVGQSKIDNLRKQYSLINKEIETLNKKMKIATDRAEKLKGRLSSEYGATFNEDGTVANYFEMFKAQKEAVNAEIIKYNGMGDAGKKNYQKTLDDARRKYDKFKELLKEYEDTRTDLIPGIKEEIQQKVDRQIEIQIESFEMEIKIRLDMSEAERQWNDFKTKVIKDIDEKDILGMTKGKLENYYSYYKDNEKGQVQAATQHVNKILTELTQMDKTGKSDIYGNDRARALEDLKEYYDKLKDSMTEAHDLADEIRKSYLEEMDKITEKFQRQVELYETVDSLIEHDKNIISLIYGEDAYDALGKFYDRQEENNNKGLDFHRREVEFWQKEMDTAEKGSEAWEKAKENWLKAVNDWNAAIEKSIENLQDKYLNTINSIFQKLNDNVTGGLGLDYVEEEWELINKNADQYLDNVNAIYETQKLQNKYLEEIEKSKDPAVQKKLNELMNKEIEGLREQDKLSKYDIERAELKYQLALKQIALEEAQQNKTSMRLRRDSQGNYSYQYVADEDRVSEMQQEISDLYNQLYNLDKNAYKDNLDQVFDIWREFQEKMAEAAQINDPEKREARELLLKQQYGELINSLIGENEDIKANLYDSTFAHLFELYGQNFENYDEMTKSQQEILDQYITKDMDLNQMAFDKIFDIYNKNVENFDSMTQSQIDTLMNSMVPQWDSGIQTMIDKIIGEGGFEQTCKGAFDAIDQATKDYQNSLQTLEDSAKTNFEGLKNGIDETIDKTNSLIENNENLVNTYRDELNAIKDVIAGLDTLIDRYEKSFEAAKKATEQAHKYWMAEQEKNASVDSNISGGGTFGDDFSPSDGSSSGNGGSGSGSATSGNGIPEIGDYVTYTGEYHYSSLGANPKGSVYSGIEDAVIIDMIANRQHKNQNHLYHIKSADGRWPDLGWVKKSQLKGFDTGGYTGEWNSKDGKLALLHQKEMVLNAKDTKNMLDIVKITRKIANNINTSVLPSLLSLNAFGNDNIGAMMDKGIEQTVNINANFPEAKDALEIENALNNLINKATQHILKR